jgi:hypothetical protein
MIIPVDAGTAPNVEMKFNATVTHLARATTEHADQLFISFSSAEHNDAVPTVSPQVGLLCTLSIDLYLVLRCLCTDHGNRGWKCSWCQSETPALVEGTQRKEIRYR